MARLTAVSFCVLVIASVAEASPVRTCPSICFCRLITPAVKKADCRDLPEWELKASDAQVVRIIPPLHPLPSAPLFLSRLDMFPKVQMFSVTNRSIIEVIPGNSATLQVLDLSHNKISRLNERAFSHMPVLRQLSLVGNPIALKRGIRLLVSSSIRSLLLGYTGMSHIPNGSLSGIPSLTSLSLQGNPLELHDGVPLVDRVSIQELDLSYCKLTKIPYHSLDNLVNLQRLYLKGNDLKTLFPEALPLNVHHIDLSANRFRDVPMTALSALKNLTNLELAKNPVKCTCDVISFLDRLSEHNVIFEKMIVCAEPEKYAKTPWKDVDERELCEDDVTSEESVDDDNRSASMSFDRDEVSYETDGPIEEENRILSQHPEPLSLQKLLQNSSRYQNMEENSIQSDQPYSNTSDEGTDHANDATTAENVLEKADDDLIVASGAAAQGESTSTESFDVSEEKHDIEKNEMSRGKDDTLVHLVAPDDTGKTSISAESLETLLRDTEESSVESKSPLRDREKLEDADEQKADLLKAPNASLEVDGQTEKPSRSSEESTEDPDSETFMRNEETVAMGKMMPESKAFDKSDEKDEPPLLLSSQSEWKAGVLKEGENSLESEGLQPHLVPTPSTSDEDPQSDEEGRDDLGSSSVDDVSSTSEAAEPKATTAETAPSGEGSSGKSSNEGSITEYPGTSTVEDETSPHPIDVPTDSWEVLHSTSLTTAPDVEILVDDRTEEPRFMSSAGNCLEKGGLQETICADTLHHLHQSGGIEGDSALSHKDNKTGQLKAQTVSQSLDHEVSDLNEKERSRDIKGMQHKFAGKNEPENEGEIETTPSPIPGSSVRNDKDGSTSPSGLFDDMDAQMASIFPDTPSTSEKRKRPEEMTTPVAPETTTEHHETSSSSSSSGIWFPFSFIPGDKLPSAVSEPGSFPAQTSQSEDLSVENNEARISDSGDVSEEGNVYTATVAYAMIAGVIVLVIIAVVCVSLRTRSDNNRKGSAPVRMRGDNASPGTEMKDMMNPLLEPIAEGQTANEFHDDPNRRPSLNQNGQNGKFPVISPVLDGVANGEPPQDDSVDSTTQVVIKASNTQPSQNGVSSAPVNGKPPRQTGTAGSKVKVVAGVIPPAIPRTPLYVKKVNGES